MIIPVQRIQLFVFNKDLDNVLKIIQTNKLMMVMEESNTEVRNVSFEDNIIQRSNKAIKYLEKYKGKKGFFEFNEVESHIFDGDSSAFISFLELIEDKEKNIQLLEEDIMKLKDNIGVIAPFETLDVNLSHLHQTVYVKVLSGFIHDHNLEEFKAFLENNKIAYETLLKDERGTAFSIALENEHLEQKTNEINRFDFRSVNLPNIDKTPKAYLTDLLKDVMNLENELKSELNSLKKYSKEINKLYVLSDQMSTIKRRKLVPYAKTEETVIISGWIREDHRYVLEECLGDAGVDYEFDLRDPASHEIPPTALENNRFVEPFETITDSFSYPNHKDIDPNPVMSIWYWLIFGIMMGDMGYGLMMTLIFGLFLKYKKPKGGFRQLVTVFFYSGFTAMIAGVLFGSFFGFDVDLGALIGSLFNQNWTTVVLTPMKDPLVMLIFSLALGVVHIICGLILKIILSIKLKDPLGALADGLSWILVLVGLTFIALSMAIKDVPMIVGIIIMSAGFLIVILLGGRDKKNFFMKIFSGIGGLYGITSYVSDILSYSRILALSLSTAVIAFTFNMLAGMLQGNIFGIIVSLLVYVVGHIFNFAMGMLSAYIHDSRLQYIEFFNKFYIGEGVRYEPLSIELNYIDEIIYT